MFEFLENASIWLTEFFDKPVPIIGCTVGFLLIAILKILSSTSIGKKSLNTLKDSITDALGKNGELVDQLNKERQSVSDLISSKEKEVDELTQEYEKRLQVVAENYKTLETLVLDICKAIQNKSVKELANKYSPMVNEGICEIYDLVKNEYKDEYDKQLEFLNSQIEELRKRLEVKDEEREDS